MAKFIYYQIEGIDSCSYVANFLSGRCKFSSKQQAISRLEVAIGKWRSESVFINYGEIVFEAAVESLLGYRHQIIFRHKASYLLVVREFKVVKHVINYDL